MWPWEHAIVGYLAYSVCCHVAFRRSPGGLEAFAVVFASVLPDLIDKPLAWEYGVFDVGYAIGHSVFFAVPLAILVGSVAHAVGRPGTGIAFGLGYLLHPVGDLIEVFFRQDIVLLELMLWPFASVEGTPRSGVLETFFHLFDGYATELLTGDLSTYRWLQIGLAGTAMVVWLLDGAPVLRDCLRTSTRAIRTRLGQGSDGSSRNEPDRR